MLSMHRPIPAHSSGPLLDTTLTQLAAPPHHQFLPCRRPMCSRARPPLTSCSTSSLTSRSRQPRRGMLRQLPAPRHRLLPGTNPSAAHQQPAPQPPTRPQPIRLSLSSNSIPTPTPTPRLNAGACSYQSPQSAQPARGAAPPAAASGQQWPARRVVLPALASLGRGGSPRWPTWGWQHLFHPARALPEALCHWDLGVTCRF